MDRDSIRTSIGRSARQVILRCIERFVDEYSAQASKRRLTLEKPIVRSTGKPVRLTNEQIYDGIEFP